MPRVRSPPWTSRKGGIPDLFFPYDIKHAKHTSLCHFLLKGCVSGQSEGIYEAVVTAPSRREVIQTDVLVAIVGILGSGIGQLFGGLSLGGATEVCWTNYIAVTVTFDFDVGP